MCSFCTHLFNKYFRYPWSSSHTEAKSWISTCIFSFHPLQMSGYWDVISAPLFQNWSFRGHQWLLVASGFQPQASSLLIQWDQKMTMECSWGERVHTQLYSHSDRSSTRIPSASEQVCVQKASLGFWASPSPQPSVSVLSAATTAASALLQLYSWKPWVDVGKIAVFPESLPWL